MSRWDRWSVPPTEIGRPFRTRVRVTRVVSQMGTTISRRGSNSVSDWMRAAGPPSISVSEASQNPMKRLPESPMKIRPAGKLKTRNPKMAPANVKQLSDNAGCPPCQKNAPCKELTSTATPAASPLTLSNRLNAFVMPTIQRAASARSKGTLPVSGWRRTKEIGVRAQTISPSSFQRGRSFQMSSAKPSKNMPDAAAASVSCCRSRVPRHSATETNETKMEMPPHTGVGATCNRPDDDRASQGNREAKRRIAKVRAAPKTNGGKTADNAEIAKFMAVLSDGNPASAVELFRTMRAEDRARTYTTGLSQTADLEPNDKGASLLPASLTCGQARGRPAHAGPCRFE